MSVLSRPTMLERIRLLAILVEKSQAELGSIGHTLLQKLVYLLEYAANINLGYEFRMYYYGPYSRQLQADIQTMNALGLVKAKLRRSGYGYNIELTAEGKDFVKHRKRDKILRRYQPGIDKIFRLLTSLGVSARNLEVVGTVHFINRIISRHEGKASEQKVLQAVRRLKPHLNNKEVLKALRKLRARQLLVANR